MIMVGGASAAGSGMFKILSPSKRPQATDIQAAVMWGVAAGTTGLWLIQPFDWIKRTFFKKQSEEK